MLKKSTNRHKKKRSTNLSQIQEIQISQFRPSCIRILKCFNDPVVREDLVCRSVDAGGAEVVPTEDVQDVHQNDATARRGD